ncbi:MAG: PepSY domain-containing protein [Methylotenera sp.]|jgi:uncharacterized membrane protein YkoI
MTRLMIGTSLFAMTLASTSAFAEMGHEFENDYEHDYLHKNFKPEVYDTLSTCLDKVFKMHDGKIVKLEYKTENKVPVYEFDVQTRAGKAWEIECRVKDGKITETEEEVKKDDPRFVKLAKITERKAEEIALAAHPGTVIEVEYELEENGDASYEFDILEADNEEIKVEVNAATGKIVEVTYESYQIGHE